MLPRDEKLIKRKIANYKIVKNEDGNIMHSYFSSLCYKYTTIKPVSDLLEMPEAINTRYFISRYRFTINGDKTFYQPENPGLNQTISKNSPEAKTQYEFKHRAYQCIEMDYRAKDFDITLDNNHVKMDKKTWDAKSGVMKKISGMATLYGDKLNQLEIKNLLPNNYSIHNLEKHKKLTLNFYQNNNHFYNHHNRIIAKLIYWSLMKSLYTEITVESRRKKTAKKRPMNFNIHQICHRTVMNAIKTKLGPEIARDIFKGGSFFGENLTVEAMQDMGIMDDDKFTSRNGFFSGNRFRIFANKPTLSPSGKEARLRNGNHPNVWDDVPINAKPPEDSHEIPKPK